MEASDRVSGGSCDRRDRIYCSRQKGTTGAALPFDPDALVKPDPSEDGDAGDLDALPHTG